MSSNSTSVKVMCCTTRTWTHVVAYGQIFLNAVSLILFTTISILAVSAVDRNETSSRAIILVLILLGTLIGLASVFGLTLGVILLKGVQKRNWRHMEIWLVCTMLLVGFYVIMLIQGTWREGLKMTDISHAFAVAIHVFFLIVVHSHKQELKTKNEAVTANAVAFFNVNL